MFFIVYTRLQTQDYKQVWYTHTVIQTLKGSNALITINGKQEHNKSVSEILRDYLNLILDSYLSWWFIFVFK